MVCNSFKYFKPKLKPNNYILHNIILVSVCAARVRSLLGETCACALVCMYEHMSVMPAGGGLGKTSTRRCARWSIGFALALYTPCSRMRELIMHRGLGFLPLLFYFILYYVQRNYYYYYFFMSACREIII